MEATITNIDLANYFSVFVEALEVLLHPLDTRNPSSWIKIQIQKFVALFGGNIYHPPQVAGQGKHVSFVDTFVYLGIAIGSRERSFTKINRCLEIATSEISSYNHSAVFDSVEFCAEQKR